MRWRLKTALRHGATATPNENETAAEAILRDYPVNLARATEIRRAALAITSARLRVFTVTRRIASSAKGAKLSTKCRKRRDGAGVGGVLEGPHRCRPRLGRPRRGAPRVGRSGAEHIPALSVAWQSAKG